MTAAEAHQILGDLPESANERTRQIASLRLHGHPDWWRVNDRHAREIYNVWRITRGAKEIFDAYGRGEIYFTQLLKLAPGAPCPELYRDASAARTGHWEAYRATVGR